MVLLMISFLTAMVGKHLKTTENTQANQHCSLYVTPVVNN